MSTTEYLESLDYTQLLKARELADELIAKKENETRVKLLVVSSGGLCHAYFRENEIDKAIEEANNIMKEDAMGDLKRAHFNLSIRSIRVIESEVEEYLKHWKDES